MHDAEAKPPLPVKKVKLTTDAKLPSVKSVLAEIKEAQRIEWLSKETLFSGKPKH